MIDNSERRSDNIRLSVIIPCYNEQAVIETTHGELMHSLAGKDFSLQLIYVDDGSSDETSDLLRKIVANCPAARLISLSRNFGHQIAVSAGLDHATGDVVAIIDADLQDPPAVILEMLEKWLQGFDVAYGQRTDRPAESWFKLLTARWFYRLINRLSDTDIPLDTGDFRLLDRRVVEAIKAMPERDRFLRGMISWAGFRQTAVPYARAARRAGESKYPFAKMLRFAVDGIISFSAQPLRLATWVGSLVSSFAILGIIYAIAMRLFTDHWVSGWTFIVVTMLFLGGIQLLFLGVIGEYIARIYQQGKERPLYFVARLDGFEDDQDGAEQENIH
jgi:glycosyltransferase involved in cell wall biosynthesis